MPKKLVVVAPRRAALIDYEEPPMRSDTVRVRVEHASPKHGTELAMFRGEDPFAADLFDEDWRLFRKREPAAHETNGNEKPVLGNQWVGVIEERGSAVQDFRVGERICGYGGIQETQLVKAVNNPYLHRVPERMSWKNALCLDPAQFALGGVRDSQARMGDRVAVFGLGAIGAIAAQMAKASGASYVAVVDPIAKRRQAALEAGADAAFDPTSQDAGLELKRATNKAGVDATIETSGNEQALQQALRGARYGGTIAFVGWARAFDGSLNLGKEAHFNNASIVFSRASSEPNRDHPRWDRNRVTESCWTMLTSGLIDCENIIAPVVSFEESSEAYGEFVDRKPHESIKLGVTFL